jgi:hypothetical protein
MIVLSTAGCTRYGSEESVEQTGRQLQLLVQSIEDSYVDAHRVLDAFPTDALLDPCMAESAERLRPILRTHGLLAESVGMNISETAANYRARAKQLRAVNGERFALMSAYGRVKQRIVDCGAGSAGRATVISAIDRMLAAQ